MKYVHIVSADLAADKARTLATCVLKDGAAAVECNGDADTIGDLKLGVYSPKSQRRVTPDDGEEFLAALAVEYHQPQLFATDVLEGPAVEPYNLPPEESLTQ